MIRLVLAEPDIAGNVGTILRLGACLGVPVDLIEPCGFPFDDRRLARAALDYRAHVDLTRHADWSAFRAARPGRLVLLTTRAPLPYTAAAFAPGDLLVLGSESSGAGPHVHAEAALSVRIPLQPGLRSLNVATAAAMVLGEALRQTGGFSAG